MKLSVESFYVLKWQYIPKPSCRYVQQPYRDGVVLPVIVFEPQFLHLHLAMLVWYISVQKKKNSTENPCRSKAQSDAQKEDTAQY